METWHRRLGISLVDTGTLLNKINSSYHEYLKKILNFRSSNTLYHSDFTPVHNLDTEHLVPTNLRFEYAFPLATILFSQICNFIFQTLKFEHPPVLSRIYLSLVLSPQVWCPLIDRSGAYCFYLSCLSTLTFAITFEPKEIKTSYLARLLHY